MASSLRLLANLWEASQPILELLLQLAPYGTGDFADIYRCRTPCRMLVWDFSLFSLYNFKAKRSSLRFWVCTVLVAGNFQSSTLLGAFHGGFGKKKNEINKIFFLFHSMSLVLWAPLPERDTNAVTQQDHIMSGDLYTWCNNCRAWPKDQ